ncbi:MAG: DUF929 domain-containing protein [Thermoplasmata archaeon]|nr:DUF929 domain-containing protein [Thermoplasmata archaeon]MCI4359551.1 DUF929 domain-containing protein [Thermoplasmata archaeon]
MVEWDLVDRRRAKGWDWDRIAEDPKVGFHAEEGAGDPGRALRALYYARRSKTRKTSGDSERPDHSGTNGAPERGYSLLALGGYVAVPLVGIWFLLALVYPSPVGVYLAAIPWVGLILAAAALLLAFGLLRSVERWNRAMRSALVVGIILGFVVSGVLAGVAVFQGCPVLKAASTQEPGGWVKAPNAEWTENGVPVFFFYGSIACPYCSASSWAMVGALNATGTLSGTYYGHSDSNPNDIPNTPEVVLATATLVSQYVALHVDESTDPQVITPPATPSCIDQAYVSAYDSTGGIPFVVLGGIYIHTNTLVDPLQLRTTPGDASSNPLTPQQVQGEINAQSGAAWVAISPQMYLMEALLVKLNHGQPTGLANDPNVANYLKQIT